MPNFKHETGYFFTAMTFLTRLPVAALSRQDSTGLRRACVYFPLVGIFVGLIIGLGYMLADSLWGADLAIVMALVLAVVVTGAFHEDGFADVLDSMGGFTTDHKLRIMKDSRLGTYAACGLACLFLVKFFAIKSALHGTGVFVLFVLAHCLSRWICLPLLYLEPYVSPDSRTGKDQIAGTVSARQLVIVTALCAAFVIAIAPASALWLIGGCAFVLLVTRTYFHRALGGITGDCLGAANQLTETMVYLVFAAHAA